MRAVAWRSRECSMRKASTTISPERRAPPSPSSRAGRRRCPRSAISSRSSIAGARARRCRRLPTHRSSSDGTMTDRIAPVALLIGALVLVSAPSDAETYRWVDEQGHVTYSDRPPQPREIRTPAPDAMPTPDVKALEPKAPDGKASGMKTFDVKVPAVKAPEVKAPEIKTSDIKAPPERKAPEMKAGPAKIDQRLELAGVLGQLAGL